MILPNTNYVPNGLPLRDHIAVVVLQSLLGSDPEILRSLGNLAIAHSCTFTEARAIWAYQTADAMLKAREAIPL